MEAAALVGQGVSHETHRVFSFGLDTQQTEHGQEPWGGLNWSPNPLNEGGSMALGVSLSLSSKRLDLSIVVFSSRPIGTLFAATGSTAVGRSCVFGEPRMTDRGELKLKF